MKQFNWKNNSWYSVILALLLVWFMLVLTVWVFRLVLNESYDTDWLAKNFSSFAWAEAGLELALLKIKENSYWYWYSIDHEVNNETVILWEFPLDQTKFNRNKETLVSYELDSSTSNLSSTIETWRYFIIPLFSWSEKVQNTINLTVSSWDYNRLVWNIVWETSWISWVGEFDQASFWNNKNIIWWKFNFINQTVTNFLSSSNWNYLILFNSDHVSPITFTLDTWSEKFTDKSAFIISTWEIGKYKQNLRLELDNSKYLNLLKYSIFSN